MYLTEKTVSLLEFDKIKAMLAEEAHTAGAREAALNLTPDDDPVRVEAALKRTTDAKALLGENGQPPFGGIKNMSSHCERAEKGAMLTPRELLDVADILRITRALIDYSKTNRRFETVLDEVFERLMPNKKLEDRIGSAIVSEDTIADSASPELGNIRRKIRQTTAKIRDVLQKYTGGAYAQYLQENIVTMRNGRYVVPVRAECKNEIKGLVHDTSSSGATFFIEPIAVVDANNELRSLEAAEKHEIEKILYEISADVADSARLILYNNENIDELAFCFACASLSEKMDAAAPAIDKTKRRIRLNHARHPLIPKSRVVPVNIRLGGDFDTLVITGPNTGGKTVTLKTLGLFALMTQSGLHIPADDTSCMCLFDRVLVDLGDDQSIEQSLSTFSSHMVNIVSIVNNLSDRALVLFDELGVGTDPIEGAALAISIISEVREYGALCAATTHYAELKSYALGTPGVTNASCEFDVESLKPTYKLTIGTPGRSCALAISERLGLPAHIIKRALDEVSSEDRRFEDVIEKLEIARINEEKARTAAEKELADVKNQRASADTEARKKLAEADRILAAANAKAASLVDGARRSSEYIFDQLERAQKAKDSEKSAEELAAARKAVRQHIKDNEDSFRDNDDGIDHDYKLPRELHKGDRVWLMSMKIEGVLLADPDKKGCVTVQAGAVRTKTKLENLKLAEDVVTFTDSKGKKTQAKDYSHNVVSKVCRDEIDLRGMTGDEAWIEVDRYLDQVVLSGLHTVRLIHGKGTGALKASLWARLHRDERVKSYRIGQFGEGDGGVTVLEMK